MHTVTPVVLCGGSGTRLWPLSRTGFPKQFLCLSGSSSLFQQAAQRLVSMGTDDIQLAPLLVVAGEDHRFLLTEQLREAQVPLGAALLEPVPRNTAAALTLAALAAMDAPNASGAPNAPKVPSATGTPNAPNELDTFDALNASKTRNIAPNSASASACANNADPILVVTPSDHAVADTAAFAHALQQAVRQAATGRMVLLGIPPDRPETAYGYLRVSAPAVQHGAIHSVEHFVEKPDATTAQRYLDNGHYFWNAGVFVLKASVWLRAIQRFRPDIAKATQHAWQQRSTDAHMASPFVRPDPVAFAAIASESIDCAVMVHGPGSEFGVDMVPLDAGWSDLGAWDSVWNALPKDTHGNAHVGDVLSAHSHDTLVHASSRLVSVVGVSHLVVVETPDAVLVAHQDHSQAIKDVVAQLQQTQRPELSEHRKVYRPWGWYDNVDSGARFKVKRIMVKPGASLSLQKHQHRAEHWIVVRGTADITRGEQVQRLTENQSTYIAPGEVHRLANPGTLPLEIIEVQSGSYLGEDDIVRYDDAYGRA